jgi:hypothetical protein
MPDQVSQSGSPHPDAIKHQVRLRLDALRDLTYEALANMPDFSKSFVRFGNANVKINTYREGDSGKTLAIIVQGSPDGATEKVLWRDVYAEGFYVQPDGTITEIPDRIRYAYM